MPIFSRARKTSGLGDSGTSDQKGDRAARSRAASFDLPVSTYTLNPRRWSGKQSESSRYRSDSNASSANGSYPAHRQLNFERGSHSKPPTTGPSRDRSSSLFTRSKDKLFRRSSGASKPTPLEDPSTQPPSSSAQAFDVYSQDEPGSPGAIDESELELVRLRDDAARSIGMTPPPPSLDDVPMKSPRVLAFENSNGTYHATTFSDNFSPIAHPARSSRADQTIRPLPPFPCTRSSLASHTQLHSPVCIYQSPTGLSAVFLKHTSRSWKSRYLVLSAYNTESNPSSSHRIRTDTLHVFKGNLPQDEEIDRLYLTVFSIVTPAGPDTPEAGNRHNVIHVSGFANGAALENNIVTSGQEVSWLFQVPDEETMRAWALRLEREVLDQRNAINTVARNFPERRVTAPTRTNSVRQSKLLVHKRPAENITPQRRPGSPLSVAANREFTLATLANGATVRSNYQTTSAANGHSPSLSYAPPRTSLQATIPAITQWPPAPPSERNKPYSHARVMSLGDTRVDDLYARSAVARFLSSMPDNDGPAAQPPSSRSGSPAPPNSLPVPPRSPRPLRGTASPTSHTRRHFSHLTSSHLDVDTDTGDEADGYVASAARATSPFLNHLSANDTLRPAVDAVGRDSLLTSAFGIGLEDEGAHIFGDDSGPTSRTRTSSASSRDPRLDRSDSRRTRGREILPPPPPPRSRPPEVPESPPSSRERTQASPSNGTTHARRRIPSMRPSTTFGGGGDQVTPPPSIKTSGVTPSSQSMRSQLSDGTTRTHGTNYETAAQDGRSSRNDSISAVATGAAPEYYPGSWAVASGFAHPYVTPSRSSHSHGSEASNPPSRRTSHEDPAPSNSERKGQRTSVLPPPRPAPTSGLPPTPADLVTQRVPKQRHGSFGSTQYTTDVNEHSMERSRPTVPSSYRDRSRRVSALPSAYRAAPPPSSPHAAAMQDPFLVTTASSARKPDASNDSLNSGVSKYVRPNSPLFASGGAVARRVSGSRKSPQNSEPRDSPYSSFLNLDTPGSTHASLPPTVRQLPLPSECLPPHNVQPLPPIAPRNFS